MTAHPARRETEDETKEECVAAAETNMTDGEPLGLVQVNCRSVYSKALELRNLIDTYNTDVVIGTESWLSENISNAELFRADYTTFRRDRQTCRGGGFICIKNYITCAEL